MQVETCLGQTTKEGQDCRGQPPGRPDHRLHQGQPQAEHQLDYDQRAPRQGGREEGNRHRSYLEALQGGELGANGDSGWDRNELVQPDRGRCPPSPQSNKAKTCWEMGQEWKEMWTQPGETSDEANKATAENWRAAVEELRDSHDRLTGATAALLMAVREAGPRLTEEALPRWLEGQRDRMEALKENLDQKQRELGAGNLGSWGQSWVLRRGLNRQREKSHGGGPRQVPRARFHREEAQGTQNLQNHD